MPPGMDFQTWEQTCTSAQKNEWNICSKTMKYKMEKEYTVMKCFSEINPFMTEAGII